MSTPTEYRIELADTTQVDRIWPMIGPGMALACRNSRSSLTSDYLWSECRSGRAFLAVVVKENGIVGASVLRFETIGDKTRLCSVMTWGRDLLKWKDAYHEFGRRMAIAGGATSMVVEGRKAHARLLPNARVVRIVYEEDV